METLITIRDQSGVDQLLEHLKDKEFVAFDTETTGTDYNGSAIIGYSISAEVDVGYYVILSYWDAKAQALAHLDTRLSAADVMSALASKKLIMHNAVFDCAMVEGNFNVCLMPSVHTDTMIASHLLNENRPNGLKDRALELYGEDATEEQRAMKESVHANGGQLTRSCYELYKADPDLLAKYGAKDAILTLKLFYNDTPAVYDEELDTFVYDEESMPLLRGPTYDLNTTGLLVDATGLQNLKGQLEAECLDAKSFVYKEIAPAVAKKYPATGKTNVFNIGSSKQLAWLLFFQLGNDFNTLTKGGKELCKALGMKLPYTGRARREFIETVIDNKGRVWAEPKWNPKTKKMSGAKKVQDPWNYLACGKESLQKVVDKYKWAERLLEYSKNMKLLNTYAIGIQTRMRYNVIHPSFLQHGTTSGRYSSNSPNFQNLPREDKRIKSCVIARPGKVFVGADYSQLEPRVFASMSQDPALMACFASGEDFYSVIGAAVFGKTGCSLVKDDKNSFAKLYPRLRDQAKVLALATPYGRLAFQQATAMGIPTEEAEMLISRYFDEYPKVELMMLESHEQVKKHGVVYNLFGRPRRIPDAMNIVNLYGNIPHHELPYQARTLLNLAMNHRVQSTGASIMNRAAIACWNMIHTLAKEDPNWNEVKIVMQIHDEMILEGPESLGESMAIVLKDAMENTTELPGVALIAEPKIGRSLADLK
jgi:DNA polymerase-1